MNITKKNRGNNDTRIITHYTEARCVANSSVRRFISFKHLVPKPPSSDASNKISDLNANHKIGKESFDEIPIDKVHFPLTSAASNADSVLTTHVS